MARERWSNQMYFIIAALGGAIGVGNLWRFPYLCYENGGGAFLIPYAIALITCGIPLLILEFGLGFSADSTPVCAFNKKFGQKYEWVGWLGILIGLGIALYYALLIAYGMHYMWFTWENAYFGDPTGFFLDYAGFDPAIGNFAAIPSTINLAVWALLFIVWGWVFVSIVKGVKSVEKMVWITVMLPFAIIAIFVVYGMSLPGASTGLSWYLTPTWEYLSKPETWLSAYSQIFFTLSLGMGYSIAYGSFLPRKSSIVRNSLTVGIVNSLASFFLGLGVFSVVGYSAVQQGLPVDQVAGSGGIGLVFIVFPEVIEILPWAAVLFGIMFFLLFVTLGIDSEFALVEGFTASFSERMGHNRMKVVIATIIGGILVGLWFSTNAGLAWLDIIDHYLGKYLLVISGLLEIVVISWIFGAERFKRELDDLSSDKMPRIFMFLLKYLSPVVLVIILVWNAWLDLETPYGGYPTWANYIGYMLIPIVLALAIALGQIAKDKPVIEDADP